MLALRHFYDSIGGARKNLVVTFQSFGRRKGTGRKANLGSNPDEFALFFGTHETVLSRHGGEKIVLADIRALRWKRRFEYIHCILNVLTDNTPIRE